MPRSGLKWIVQVRGERGEDSDEDISEDEPMLGEDTGIRGYSDVKSSDSFAKNEKGNPANSNF